MTLLTLKQKAQQGTLTFTETIEFIHCNYLYQPAEFRNGSVLNEAGKNEGSCKIFAFAQLNNFTVAETLQCFGDYYRHDVLNYPEGTDHANIRQFIQTGWEGVHFERNALTPK